MLLRRKKKKQQKKLLEAQQQQALLASLQSGGEPGVPPIQQPVYGLRRPPSAMSVPTMMYHGDYEEEEELSGSEPSEIETMDPIEYQHNLATAGVDLQVPNHPQQRIIMDGYDHSPPSQSLPYQSQPHQMTTTANHQQYASSSMMPSVSTQNLSKDYHRKAVSQPAYVLQQQASVPATIEPPPMTQQQSSQQAAMAQQIQHQAQQIQQTQQLLQHAIQQVQMSPRQRTNGNSSTLRRNKEREQKKIPPEKQELITTAISLGLGRGINATDRMPWLNKTPFQVRRVHTSIVETNEGCILVNYNNEVQSIAEVEEKFLGSLNPPESTVTIHIEDELDRNVSSSRRIVGRRVVNRSIGFQADFEEKYKDGETTKLAKESFLIPKDPAEIVYNTQESSQTFEERVCQWILHRLVRKCSVALSKTDENPIEQLAKIIQANKAVPAIENEIKNGCQELVQSLRITHYVTGIQLGASEYRIMSDGQYNKKIASEGAFAVDTVSINVSAKKNKQSKKEAMKCSQLRHIGKINDDRVAKGTQDEVVLLVQVQPITRLIKLPVLKLAMKAALEKHMEGTPSTEGGPFVIKCTGRDLYLTANKFNNYEVEATDIPTEASLFYFQTTDDGGNPFEFHIAYYGEDADPNDQTSEGAGICRYLEAPLNPQGRCPGPLLMKHSVKVKNTRFTLRSRLSKKSSRSHLQEWMEGEDAFYVACATKKYQHGSYLAVKNTKNTGDLLGKHFFMTYCDSSIHSHNGDNSFMLFQLCTKEAILSKGYGGETPGKLPLMELPKEVDTRIKKN